MAVGLEEPAGYSLPSQQGSQPAGLVGVEHLHVRELALTLLLLAEHLETGLRESRKEQAHVADPRSPSSSWRRS